MFMLIKLLSFNLLTHSPDVNECAGNVSVCDDHANCTDSDGSFLCTCNTGFSGNGYYCSSEILASIKLYTNLQVLDPADINECESGSYICDSNAMCEDNVGSYQCVCVTGYSGSGDTCSDVDECQSSPCHDNATCTNTNGSYTCQCTSDFIGDGFDCTRE